MNKLAIIGGTGLSALAGVTIDDSKACHTPYGEPSAKLVFGNFAGRPIVFLARHGNPHVIPPHQVNYRANLWALKSNGVEHIIAVNAVGGITAAMAPERIVIPDQIIDYTWSRQHTFFEDDLKTVTHVDFTHPYSALLRQKIIAAAAAARIDTVNRGTYGATQGPRLETAAEIDRMQRDSCDIVGMTGMPEAGLARELGLDYASICLVVNWAAGKSTEEITMAIIEGHLKAGMNQIMLLLTRLLENLEISGLNAIDSSSAN
ncbi:MAG: mtnP [Gammaproteobacteria bacterium]|nr:mtnP [Gammaproteobacteria bacterium]